MSSDQAFRGFLSALAQTRTIKDSMRLSPVLIAEQFDCPTAMIIDSDSNLVSSYGLPKADITSELIESILSASPKLEIPGVGDCYKEVINYTELTREINLYVFRSEELTTTEKTDLYLLSRVLGLVFQSHWNIEAERDVSKNQERELKVFESILRLQRMISRREPIEEVLTSMASESVDLLASEISGIKIALASDGIWVQTNNQQLEIWFQSEEFNGLNSRCIESDSTVQSQFSVGNLNYLIALVPIKIDDDVEGVMYSIWTEKDVIDSQTEGVMSTLAGQASLAISDSQTLKELEDSYIDSLTGLNSRNKFLDSVEIEIQKNSLSAFLFIDLDGFKQVNDNYGHQFGDRLLKIIAKRLQNNIRPGDIAGRLGGDEFAILLTNLEDKVDAEILASRLGKISSEPVTFDNTTIIPKLSIGIGFSTDLEVDELVHQADLAMYAAKVDPARNVVVANKSQAGELEKTREFGLALSKAVPNNEMSVVFQPIISLSTGNIEFLQSQIRWELPGKGIILPKDFLPTAETNGSIEEIDNFLLKKTVAKLKLIREEIGNTDLKMLISLSPNEYSKPGFVGSIIDLLDQNLLPFDSVFLEIARTANDSATRLDSTFDSLNALGVGLLVDSVGSGKTSLTSLLQINVDLIRIDKSLIDSLEYSEEAFAIVSSIVDIGKALKSCSIATGINSEHMLQKVKGLGIEYGQGEYLYPAMTFPDLNNVINPDKYNSIDS